MKKIALAALPLAFAVTACGSADDASTAAEADTVEMPADDALNSVDEVPVADPTANVVADSPAEEVEDTAEATAAEAGANAADVAARAQAAAAAADAATENVAK